MRDAAADADVLAAGGLAGRLERLGRRRVDEVERRAALHLDRRARVMGEDEDRRVERRVGTPPALPLRVLVPAGRAELPGTHDLGADPRIVQPQEGVVDAARCRRARRPSGATTGSRTSIRAAVRRRGRTVPRGSDLRRCRSRRARWRRTGRGRVTWLVLLLALTLPQQKGRWGHRGPPPLRPLLAQSRHAVARLSRRYLTDAAT